MSLLCKVKDDLIGTIRGGKKTANASFRVHSRSLEKRLRFGSLGASLCNFPTFPRRFCPCRSDRRGIAAIAAAKFVRVGFKWPLQRVLMPTAISTPREERTTSSARTLGLMRLSRVISAIIASANGFRHHCRANASLR